MARNKLDQYKGRLTPSQVADGINAARRNAKRLVDDAESLLKAGSFPTAASLAALAIEEAGKVSILRSLALARNEAEAIDAWRDYRSHTRKNVTWLIGELAAKGARMLDDFAPLFDPESDHPHLLDQIKQLGFYTDCLEKAHWSDPSRVIDESLAQSLVFTAKILSTGDNTVTPKEIELWIRHVGPVWKRHPSWMKKALENWYEDMQAAGLAPSGANQMTEFIRDGLKSSRPKKK